VTDSLKWTITLVQGADGYRLPTEAEWEYGCRAGTTTLYSLPAPAGGNIINITWANYNSAGPRAVKSYAAYSNNRGIFDMHGNVREWCWDWYDSNWYTENPAGNPVGSTIGSFRVVRGGGWKSTGDKLRSSCRDSEAPNNNTQDDLGFRVLRPKYPEGIPSSR
jgi:formylglycine-generating enzyme required for sulfatase activity